ncbi:MAG: prepilin-type N-terminal cleavage/methylation domain-containing protein [Gallionellaceae bacterium]|nr:prepilin-type N-terminal cleavage/methylation domain-containing protein [Gallionellaceae bacterium]
MSLRKLSQLGFTLVEMIVVMVITGIIGGMIAMFIKAPMQSYMDSGRRAEMVDIADTALRRMGRDIRTAVPNSIRTTTCGAVGACLEFLPTKAGGRYRGSAGAGPAQCGGAVASDVLDFGSPDGCFEIIGPQITFVSGVDADHIVIGSTQSSGNPPYEIATSGVLRAYTVPVGAQSAVNFTATQFPAFAEVPGQRFDVVPGDQQAVTYVCTNPQGTDTNNDGQSRLIRYWHYGFRATQTDPATLAATSAVLADKVSSCAITYNAINQRNGLVSITLTITRGGESISLYHETHVNNIP